MSENKMPEKVFVSNVLMNPGTDQEYGYCYPVVKHPNTTSYIRADLVPQWIPVSERLPEYSGEGRGNCVLVVMKRKSDKYITLAAWTGNFGWRNVHSLDWFCIEDYGWEVTHWQPLPQFPTEEA